MGKPCSTGEVTRQQVWSAHPLFVFEGLDREGDRPVFVWLCLASKSPTAWSPFPSALVTP